MESPVYLGVTPGNLYRQSASKRLLWASRLSKEKRPTLLGPLAKQLESECPGVTIECWGSGDESALGAERPDNLRFRGAFDHPLDLPFSEYDAFLYTSLYDGMPNIVVEALSQGIIVIASDVGAISHYIEDGSSGYLIQQSGDDFIDATRFTASIKRLYERWETTATTARNGQQKAAPHLLEAYLKHTENLLEFLAQCSAKTAIPLV
jgi:glycosyltransferase involved in cell wall biosynthesis